MRNIIILLAVIVIALLVSGCCSCNIGDLIKPNANPTIISKTITATTKGVIGSWTNNKAYGELTDPESAFNNGVTGIWMLYSSDGTFDEVILLSNSQYGGIMENVGDYKVAGSTITETNVLKSWYPDTSRHDQPAKYVDQPIDDFNYKIRSLSQNTMVLNNGQGDITLNKL
jgi:hypothetical protein